MEEKENGKNMLIGAVSLTVSVFIVKLLGFLYKLPISRLLGDEGMGYFNTAYAIYGFFYILCTAGVPKAMTVPSIVSITTVRGSFVSMKKMNLQLPVSKL